MTAAPASFSRRTPVRERLVEAFLVLSAAVGILTTVGIVAVLVIEAVEFFRLIPLLDYLTGPVWSASIKPFRFGILPLITGTLLVAGLALALAIPLGLASGIYLAEYASPRVRTVLKPVLELIAGIPTVVLGFFAINFISPVLLKSLVPGIGGFSVLAGGIVVGILVTPLIASLSEDALRAVPRGLREGAVAMGATKFELVRRVVVPAALSGIMASIILAMSRAVGETMAVVLAVGANPQLTLDVRESVQTMTAFIAQISLGDTPAGSIQFKALFAVGATLFLMTLLLNLLSDRVVARFRNRY